VFLLWKKIRKLQNHHKLWENFLTISSIKVAQFDLLVGCLLYFGFALVGLYLYPSTIIIVGTIFVLGTVISITFKVETLISFATSYVVATTVWALPVAFALPRDINLFFLIFPLALSLIIAAFRWNCFFDTQQRSFRGLAQQGISHLITGAAIAFLVFLGLNLNFNFEELHQYFYQPFAYHERDNYFLDPRDINSLTITNSLHSLGLGNVIAYLNKTDTLAYSINFRLTQVIIFVGATVLVTSKLQLATKFENQSLLLSLLLLPAVSFQIDANQMDFPVFLAGLLGYSFAVTYHRRNFFQEVYIITLLAFLCANTVKIIPFAFAAFCLTFFRFYSVKHVSVIALALLAPTLVLFGLLTKNYIITGNPVFHTLNGLFKSQYFMQLDYLWVQDASILTYLPNFLFGNGKLAQEYLYSFWQPQFTDYPVLQSLLFFGLMLLAFLKGHRNFVIAAFFVFVVVVLSANLVFGTQQKYLIGVYTIFLLAIFKCSSFLGKKIGISVSCLLCLSTLLSFPLSNFNLKGVRFDQSIPAFVSNSGEKWVARKTFYDRYDQEIGNGRVLIFYLQDKLLIPNDNVNEYDWYDFYYWNQIYNFWHGSNKPIKERTKGVFAKICSLGFTHTYLSNEGLWFDEESFNYLHFIDRIPNDVRLYRIKCEHFE
jgi:hypothetical protein